ncbi:MAG: 3-methyl-2-oxobutanoate hydroxymethyltransferase [Fibrobacterota bacterium]
MKITVQEIKKRKHTQTPLVMLTSYDYPTACIEDRCNVDIQLVGDSVGTNVLGYESIRQVTVEDIEHHTGAVSRGAKHSFVLSDMPYNSYQTPRNALTTARRLIKAGSDGVKIEGEQEVIPIIQSLTDEGIAVCGHIGYTPQTKSTRVHGKNFQEATMLLDAARRIEQAGAFAIVLELIPEQLAHMITTAISIPTFGIGAGRYCDGQVQVVLDILGMNSRSFRHTHAFGNLSQMMEKAIEAYSTDVAEGRFPTEKNASRLPDETLTKIKNYISSQSW